MRRRSLLATTTLLLLTALAGPSAAETFDPERVGEPEKAWYDTGFEDVPGSHVFAEHISWLAYTEISTGYEREDGFSDFRPSQPVLREQMAAFLYRFATSYRQDDDGPSFIDVPAGHAFFHHVEWLAGTGITTGYDNGNGSRSFSGSQPVLREQMAAFLWRYAGSPRVADLPARSPFRDVPTTHVFYEAIVWLADQGISTGYDDGTFRPGQSVLREQMAAFLARLHVSDVAPLAWFGENAETPEISDSGRYVVFASKDPMYADAVGHRSNDRTQIYLVDRETMQILLVSESTAGGPGDADSRSPFVDDTGRFVVWTSTATNLVTGDAGTTSDVFSLDTHTGVTTMVNRQPDGTVPTGGAHAAALSGDGSTVALWITSGEAPMGSTVAHVVDRRGGNLEPVRNPAGGQVGMLISGSMSISDDGTVVAVETTAHLTIWTRGTPAGVNGDSSSTQYLGSTVVSGDGSQVLFTSENRSIVGGDDPHYSGHAVYAHDVSTGVITRLEDADGVPMNVLEHARLVVSDDGRHVGAADNGLELLDRARSTVTVVARGLRGEPLHAEPHYVEVRSAALSGDGTTMVFVSNARNLQPTWAPDPLNAMYVWERPSS